MDLRQPAVRLDGARTGAGAPEAVLVDTFQRRAGWPHPADAAPWDADDQGEVGGNPAGDVLATHDRIPTDLGEVPDERPGADGGPVASASDARPWRHGPMRSRRAGWVR